MYSQPAVYAQSFYSPAPFFQGKGKQGPPPPPAPFIGGKKGGPAPFVGGKGGPGPFIGGKGGAGLGYGGLGYGGLGYGGLGYGAGLGLGYGGLGYGGLGYGAGLANTGVVYGAPVNPGLTTAPLTPVGGRTILSAPITGGYAQPLLGDAYNYPQAVYGGSTLATGIPNNGMMAPIYGNGL